MNTCTYDLPAHWVGAIFYGEIDDFTEEEEEQFTRFIHGEELPDPIDVTDSPQFMTYHDARDYGVLACDCLTFTFPA